MLSLRLRYLTNIAALKNVYTAILASPLDGNPMLDLLLKRKVFSSSIMCSCRIAKVLFNWATNSRKKVEDSNCCVSWKTSCNYTTHETYRKTDEWIVSWNGYSEKFEVWSWTQTGRRQVCIGNYFHLKFTHSIWPFRKRAARLSEGAQLEEADPDAAIRQTAQDFEDMCNEEFGRFKPASREIGKKYSWL